MQADLRLRACLKKAPLCYGEQGVDNLTTGATGPLDDYEADCTTEEANGFTAFYGAGIVDAYAATSSIKVPNAHLLPHRLLRGLFGSNSGIGAAQRQRLLVHIVSKQMTVIQEESFMHCSSLVLLQWCQDLTMSACSAHRLQICLKVRPLHVD